MFAVLAIAVGEWSIVSICAAAATCIGAVKLTLDTVKAYQEVRDKKK